MSRGRATAALARNEMRETNEKLADSNQRLAERDEKIAELVDQVANGLPRSRS